MIRFRDRARQNSYGRLVLASRSASPHHASWSSMDLAAPFRGCSIMVRRTLQVQVILKSRGKRDIFFGMSDLLTISEVSGRSGVAASALRFYEERGLIKSERAGSGHRRYPRPALRRIAFIVFAQRIGLTLKEIVAELAKLPPERAPNRRDWSRLSS